MGVNPDFKFIATERFSMSLLDQKPTMKNFSEAIQGLSLSTREGISLFGEGCGEHKLKLQNIKSYDSGVVQLHYQS